MRDSPTRPEANIGADGVMQFLKPVSSRTSGQKCAVLPRSGRPIRDAAAGLVVRLSNAAAGQPEVVLGGPLAVQS